jgi:hypothetical protein
LIYIKQTGHFTREGSQVQSLYRPPSINEIR